MVESGTVEKRGPGRPPKATPAPKRQKLSHPTPKESTPTNHAAQESPSTQQPKTSGLPYKLSATAPLPALLQPQSLALSDSEYQSLASSAVLAASLERSQQAWTRDGIFERFWKKPEGRQKGSDPVLKSMKDRGRCRLRIEPHIFEVNLWVVTKPKPPAPPKAQAQQYRPPQQNQYFQNRPLPPAGQPQMLAPLQGQQAPSPQPPAQSPTPTPTPTQDNKPSPDPVISMLATRASSDPELKALMKVVATGQATQEQLKVFQKHIDELSAAIQAQKAKEAAEEAKRAAKQAPVPQHQNITPQPVVPYTSSPQPGNSLAWQQPMPPPQQYVPPPPPPPSEVVFAFTLAGATEDRFLFPQYSILEALSAQHVLASFIVTRRGSEAADPVGLKLDPDTEYWQPVTMMVEVAYGREPLLKDVQKWVKPPDEVREEMKKIMARCTRAPDTFLPLRLPTKSNASYVESEATSKTVTPAPDDKKVPKAKSATAAKRSSLAKEGATAGKEKSADEKGSTVAGAANAAQPVGNGEPATTTAEQPAAPAKADDGKQEADDGGKPRRATRKSVRISEV